MKITFKKFLFFLLVIPAIVVFAWIGLMTIYFASPLFETVYAPGFSRGAFNQVTPGMSSSEVLGILGEPLEKNETKYSPEIIWYYSKGKNLDANYFARGIYFRDGRVRSVFRETSYD